MTDADSFLLSMVSDIRARPTRPEPNVRVLARSDAVAQAIADIVSAAGGNTLALTLPDDVDDALGLLENLLPGADLVVIAANVAAPIRDALDVVGQLTYAAGVIAPGGDSAWGFIGKVPLVLLPDDEFEATIAAHVIAVPAVRARSAAPETFAPVRAVAVDSELVGGTSVRSFVPGRVSVADVNVVSPMPYARSLAAADVLLVVPAGCAAVAGDQVGAISLRGDW